MKLYEIGWTRKRKKQTFVITANKKEVEESVRTLCNTSRLKPSYVYDPTQTTKQQHIASTGTKNHREIMKPEKILMSSKRVNNFSHSEIPKNLEANF